VRKQNCPRTSEYLHGFRGSWIVQWVFCSKYSIAICAALRERGERGQITWQRVTRPAACRLPKMRRSGIKNIEVQLRATRVGRSVGRAIKNCTSWLYGFCSPCYFWLCTHSCEQRKCY
jgi:hypothetical protein